MSDSTRNCWHCACLRMSPGGQGYSELTPGYDMSLECSRNHWQFDAIDTSEREARLMFRKAETCADFLDVRTVQP